MKENEINWLKALKGKAKAQDAVVERQQKRDVILDNLEGQVQKMRFELHEGMSQTVTDGKREQKTLEYGLRDQVGEFDTDEMHDGFALKNDEDFAALQSTAVRIMKLKNELELEVDVLGPDGNPIVETDADGNQVNKRVRLFSDQEISKEFFRPLVRQGLMPENFVPDAYSETKEMIEGSFEAYGERVKEEQRTKSLKGKVTNLVIENFDVTMSCFGLVGSAAEGVGVIGTELTQSSQDISELGPKGLLPNLDRFTDLRDPNAFKKTESAAALINTALSLPGIGKDLNPDGGHLDIEYDEIDKKKLKREVNKRVAKAPVLARSIIGAVTASLGKKLQRWNLGMTVSTSYNSAVKENVLRDKLASDPLDESAVRAAVDVLADAYKVTMASCDPGTLGDLLKNAGREMAGKFKNKVNAGTLLQNLEQEAFSKVVTALSKAGKEAADHLVDRYGTQLEASAKELQGQANKKLVEEFEYGEREDEKQRKEELDRLVATKDAKLKAGVLEKKVGEMKKVARFLKTAENIMNLEFDAASHFLAPMAIAGNLFSFGVNVLRAAKRMRDFLVFLDQQHDMFEDASPFSAPVHQFVKNSKVQSLHYTTQAACDLVKLIGSIVETAGTAAGPGAALVVTAGKTAQATGSVMASAEQVLYDIKKRIDLEKAWKSYRNALLRPDNRKLALVAMDRNPTLAKYAVAWGAVIKRDPLVGDFMSKCGLNAETLKDPKSKLSLVVDYLELRLPDDNIVEGRGGIATDWEPKPIELTLGCWQLAKTRGESRAKVVPQTTRAINGAFASFDSSYGVIQKKLEADPAYKPTAGEKDRCLDDLKTLLSALGSYLPMRKSKGGSMPHRQMQSVLKKFTAKAGTIRTQVKALGA